MEVLFANVARTVGTLVEGTAVVVVTYGVCEALFLLIRLPVGPSSPPGARTAVRRRFGTWLLLGLEFALAADIIATAISPTWNDIGELGAIAVIRTFLNYFLERDLASTEPERKDT